MFFQVLSAKKQPKAQSRKLTVELLESRLALAWLTNPAPSVTEVAPDTYVLRKELSGYGNYGVADHAADVLYSHESGSWTYDLSSLLGSARRVSHAEFSISGVLDDHYNVSGPYVGSISTNGVTQLTGSFPYGHGSPFGRVFNNWSLQTVPVTVTDPTTFSITISNNSNLGGGDWIAMDYINLRVELEPDHCQPGDVFSNVGLPALELDMALVKSTPLQLAFDPLGLNFTVQTPGPGVECVAQSNVGTLIASIRSTATGETHAVGYSTAQATLTLFDTGLVHWQTSGFEIRAGSVLGVPVPIPLGTWGPYSYDFNVTKLGLTADTDFETIVRAAEPYIHEQLTQQLFEPFTQILVIEDPGQTELLVTGPSGQRVGATGMGAIVQEIPGSAYFASVPLVALVAPRGGEYETQVRGIGSGNYTIVTALINGQSILTSQTFIAPSTSGLTTVYNTTLDIVGGVAHTTFQLGQSLDVFMLLPDRLRAEGKITNSGIANSLSKKLSNARASLAAGDINAARGLLTAFLHEVQAQQGRHIAADVADDLMAYDSYLLTLLV